MPPEGEGQFSGEGQGYEPLAPKITVAGHVKRIWVGEQLAQKQAGKLCTEVFSSGIIININ